MQTVIFSWSGTNALYEVQYKEASSDVWLTPSGSPVAGTSISISNLEDSTTYNFRVRSINKGSVSDWVYQTLTTSSPSCGAVSNLSLIGASQNAVNVSWSASGSALNGYIVQWKKTTSLNWLSSNTVTSPFFTISGLQAGTSYNVKVVSLCAGAGTADSGISTFSTTSTTFMCSDLSISTLAISAVNGTYTASWVNVGGTPETHLLEYSTDGVVWTEVVSIISKGLTSAVYKLPLLGQFPKTHQLRVTPKCADDSYGTPSSVGYTQPSSPTQYVVFKNSLNTASISFINIDGSANILSSNIAPGDSLNWNQTGLLNATHSANGKLLNLATGTPINITHTRNSSIISQGSLIWDGIKFPFAIAETFQDGDIFEITQ